MRIRSENLALGGAAAAVVVILAIIAVEVSATRSLAAGGQSAGAQQERNAAAGGKAARRTAHLTQARPPSRRREEDTTVQVSADRVLATVNGAPIRREHLIPPGSGDREVTMKREMFRLRLERAIEAELVFQAALERGIGFTQSQQRRLDRMTPNHEPDVGRLQDLGIAWHSLTEDQVIYKRRMMEAMLLRQNLVAEEAGVAPSPDRATQAAYEEALRKLLDRLESEADIERSPEVSG